MVGRTLDYSSVPTAPELENNSNQKKYTVNQGGKGELSISKPVCALFVMGALLLAAVAAVVTYFLVPCDGISLPESFTKTTERIQASTVDYVRLPKSIYPTHYRLFIAPELTNFTTSGNVTIRLKLEEDTNDISLNTLDLVVDKHSISVRQVKNGNLIPVSKQEYDEYSQIYTITLKEFLNPSEEYDLFMNFTGRLNVNLVGFYRSHYEDVNKTIRWIASTQFSPIDARRAFPCFDEPSFKAKFRINIGRTKYIQSLSNMEKESTTIENDLYWDHYHETPIMSPHIVAFAVNDFRPYQSTAKNFTIWAREDRIRQGVYAGEIGPKVLKYYENYFDVKYPLAKLDLMALPEFGFSAMENWGLLTFKESKLLYDERMSTVGNKRDLALTLSHELAHQWFGNLVTPKWWDDLWLKEGFSTYFQYLAVNEVEPTWNILDEFYQSEIIKGFEVDKLSSSRPIHFNVQNNNDIRQVFDRISYSKGAALVRMLANILGPETFKNGLRKFLTKKQYSNANNIDLWEVLDEQAHNDNALATNKSVKDIMVTWMTQAGFPVVTVVADRTKNELHLSQKRFLINGDIKSEEKWWIPISYTTPSAVNFEDSAPKAWLHEDSGLTLNLNLSSWYLINIKQAGYYIVNYDEQNWKRIIEDIMKMPPTTRAQLVSDAMDLAKAGLLDYAVPLNMITTIARKDLEINYINLLAIFEKTNYLHNMLASTAAFGKFELFFLDIFNIAFEVVQFGEAPTDNYLTLRIRSLVQDQSCRKSDTKCTIDARLKYRSWMGQPVTNAIPPNEREIIYCTAIREGSDAEWNAAYEAYKTSRSEAEKYILLKALGCSSKQWVLAKYLDMMLSNGSAVRKEDGIFIAVASNHHGYNLAFDFLRNRWDEINQYFGAEFRTVSKMVESLSMYMNTPFQLQQLESFKKENKYNLKATEQAFDNTIEIVKANIEWMKTNYKSVDDWLTEHLRHFNYRKK